MFNWKESLVDASVLVEFSMLLIALIGGFTGGPADMCMKCFAVGLVFVWCTNKLSDWVYDYDKEES